MKVDWKGVYPAVTTKFTDDDQLDIPAIEKNIEAQISAGVHGIVLGGTLGEASSLSNEEKQSIVSTRSALDATQAGYEVGTRNVVDVLNAANTLFSAERDYANARYDYILNTMRLKEQAGLLSPEDVNTLDSYLETPPPPTAASTK